MKRLREGLVLLVLVGLGVSAGGIGTLSAFAGTATSQANRIQAGDVALSGEGTDVAVLSVTGATPGAQPPRCVTVTNAGSLDTEVRLYAAMTGDLAPHLRLKVTRGTASSTAGGACDGFAADAGGGVLFDATLDTFPTTSTAALVDPAPWAPSEKHAYRFELTLSADPAGQGRSTTIGFTWEGRST